MQVVVEVDVRVRQIRPVTVVLVVVETVALISRMVFLEQRIQVVVEVVRETVALGLVVLVGLE
jgi:hypothetical protein